MHTDSHRTETDPPPPSPRGLLGLLFGRRRTLVVDPRYQLRVAGAAAGLMIGGALLFSGAIHLEIVRVHEIVSLHDPNIARALEDKGSIDIALIAVIGAGLSLGALLVALVETHRVAGPVRSLRRALARIQEGDYATPAQVRRGDRLEALVAGVNEIRETLAGETAEEAAFLETLAERVEAVKGEAEAAILGADLRDHAARKRARLSR